MAFSKFKTHLFIFTIIIISFFSWRELLRPGFFPMHDDLQAMRLLQMDKCIKDGQIPCRWVPDMGYGYGYPQFNYYPPLPYYVMEIFHLLGFSILDSVKAVFALSIVLSGLTMFIFVRSLFGDLAGFISAVFYMYAPFRASDIYTRGAVGEFCSFVFLPLVFWSSYQLARSGKIRCIAWLALSYGSLLVTHNQMSLIFTPILIVWSLLIVFLVKNWGYIFKFCIAGLWGIGLAAFFIIPALFEMKFAHTETLLSGYFNYLAHFVSLRQMFFSTHWGFGSSELGPFDDLSFSIGILHWLFSASSLIGAAVLFKKNKTLSVIIFFIAAFGILAAFLAHNRSVWIWNHISVLAYLQFPWRFLVISTFSFSVLSGVTIYFIRGMELKILFVALAIPLVLLFNAFFFRPREWFYISDQEKFSGELWEKQLTISIFDYLPIYATMPPSHKAPEMPQIVGGQAKINQYQKGTNWQSLKLEVQKEEVTVLLPLFDFPGWQVAVDDKKVETNHDNSLGLLTFTVEKGTHDVKVRLKDTPVRLLSNMISLFSLLSFFFLLSGFIRKVSWLKKWQSL